MYKITDKSKSGSSTRLTKRERSKKDDTIRGGPAGKNSTDLSSDLHSAVRQGNKTMLKKLLKKYGKKGNNLNLHTDAYGQTILHIAAEEGNLDVVTWLMEKYGLDANAQDTQRWTPLFCACKAGHLNVIEHLLENQSDPCLMSKDEATVLHYFVRKSQSRENTPKLHKILNEFLLRGVEIDCQNVNGETAIHMAGGNYASMEFLLRRGAKVDSVDRYGETALHKAVKAGCEPVIKILLDYGANKELKGDEGTPLDIATKYNKDLIPLLKSYKPSKKTAEKTSVTVPKRKIKVLLLGDPSSGVDDLLATYLKHKPTLKPVDGDAEHVKGAVMMDGLLTQVEVLLGKHDRKERARQFDGTDVFILVFSKIDPPSLSHVRDVWLPEANQYDPETPFVLVGMHGNLEHSGKSVTAQMAQQFGGKLRASRYLEAGADGMSITRLFEECLSPSLSPTTRELKDGRRRKQILNRVAGDVQACKEAKRSDLSLRKKGLENVHIPNTFGKQLRHLQKLYLNDNKLNFVPLTICDLPRLHTLVLKNNNICSIPDRIVNLKSLKRLDFDNNDLIGIPGKMGSMTHLEELKLRNNPRLDRLIPPEAFRNGTKAILGFLRDLDKGAERCYRMKLMFVGKEAAGKTSLSHYLVRGKKLEKPPLSTDGIDVADWQINVEEAYPELAAKFMKDNWGKKPISLSVWDFAGQEVYYSTHQFYLSRRSIYLVVFNLADEQVKKGNYHRVLYWLQSVGSKARGSPVMVIGTRVDVVGAEFAEKVFAKMKETFSKFNIKHYLGVSSHTGIGIKELTDCIVQDALKQKNMGEYIPTFYLKLERYIDVVKRKKIAKNEPPTMVLSQMLHHVQQKFGVDAEQTVRGLEFLHELGSVVYFNDPKSGLDDIVILSPDWLTDVMATIVSSKTMSTKGILQHEFLRSHIWKGDEFPEHLHHVFLRLLGKFQIAFQLRRRRPILRATQDVIGPTANQLSFSKGDKVILLDKHGKWWRGMAKGNTGYFKEDTVRIAEEEGTEYTVEDESLIPCLLPEATPPALGDSWPAWDSLPTCGRRWTFKFLPLPFFSMLIVRLLHFCDPVLYWRYGILVEKEDVRALVVVDHAAGTLDLLLRGTGALSVLIGVIEEEVDNLKDWFGVKFSAVMLPCTACLAARKQPVYYPIAEVEAAVFEGKPSIKCERDKRSAVVVAELAPDFALAEYSHIPFKELDLQDKLGEGAFATVHRAEYHGQAVAVKQLHNAKGFKEFRREVKFMSKVEHTNIVELLGICVSPPCIITEFMDGGDLHKFLTTQDNAVTWKTCQKIAVDTALGIRFLHSQKPPKIHRDLKSPNVLISLKDGRLEAKVADFGLSRSLAYTMGGRKVDNPIWLAPEIMMNQEYTEKADVYSYGIILYEIISRKFPFGKKTRFQIEIEVCEGARPELPLDTPPFWRDLCERAWAHDPANRPSMDAVLTTLKEGPKHVRMRKALQDYVESKEGDDLLLVEGDVFFVLPGEELEGPEGGMVRCQVGAVKANISRAFLAAQSASVDFAEHFASVHNIPEDALEPSLLSDGEDSETESRTDTSASFMDEDHEEDSDTMSDTAADDSVDFRDFGFVRVLDDAPGTLPHAAQCLDNTPSLQNEHEVLLELHMMLIERTSMQHIRKNHPDVTSCIMNIVPQRGKMHNPSTNSGGVLIGRVLQVGTALQDRLDVSEGDVVIPMADLSTVPLRVASVGGELGNQLVYVSGNAVVFGRHSLFKVPEESVLEHAISLTAVEVATHLSHLEDCARKHPTGVFCIVGCGKIGLVAMCYLRSIAPKAKLICVDMSSSKVEIALSLMKADVVETINARDTRHLLKFVYANTGGRGADVVLNCAVVSGIESACTLAARKGGTVVFCSGAATRLDLVTNSSVERARVLVGGSFSEKITKKVVDLLCNDKQLSTIISAFVKIRR